MPISKKKPRFHFSRKTANDAVWMVDTRWNHFALVEGWDGNKVVSRVVEERWNNWAPILETNVKEPRLMDTPSPKAAMTPRTLEDAIAIAVNELSKWHLATRDKYQVQVRLRHTTNGDIIPAELFA